MALTSKTFWADAGERAIRTVAQTALSLLTVDGSNALKFTSGGFWSTVLLAGVLSLLTSVVASGVGNQDSASMVPEVRS